MTTRTGIRAVGIVVLVVLLSGPVRAEEDDGYRAFKDTDVSLKLPAGFVPATAFLGFQHPTHGASLLLKVYEQSWESLADRFTPETFAALRRKYRSRQEVEVAGRTAHLFELALSRQGYEYLEWMLVLPDGERTVAVEGIYPVIRAGVMGEKMKEAVLSTRIGSAKEVDVFAGLPFTIEFAAPFAPARSTPGTLLFTHRGVVPIGKPAAPLFAVGAATGAVKTRDRKKWSYNRLKAATNIHRLKIVSRIEIEVDGLPAVEIVSEGLHRGTDIPLRAYQLVVFDTDTYYIAQGFAGTEAHAAAIDAFKKMARSLTRKKAEEE